MCTFYTTKISESVDSISRSLSLNLPIELCHVILDFAAQPDVLALAGVSRGWRSAAVMHDGYYWYIPLYRCSVAGAQRRPKAPQFAHARAALERATRTRTRVALQVNLISLDKRPSLFGWRQLADQRVMAALCHTLRAAMGVSIIALDVVFRDWSADLLDTALGTPAPFLETMTLTFTSVPWNRRPVTVLFAFARIPSNIFLGHAPRLRHVVLNRICMPDDPVIAFMSVISARIQTICYPAMNLKTHLPSVHSLDLSLWLLAPIHNPAPALLDLRGMQLRRLRLVRLQTISSHLVAQLPDVPDLEISGFHGIDIDAHWDAIGNPVTVISEEVAGPVALHILTVKNSDRRLRLGINELLDVWPQLLQKLPHILRLELSLSLAGQFFYHMKHTNTPDFGLASLVCLVIAVEAGDSRSPPNIYVPKVLHCPSLQELVVIGHNTELSVARLSTSVVVDLAKCLALGLTQSGVARRGTLLLRGIYWKLEEALDSFDAIRDVFDIVVD